MLASRHFTLKLLILVELINASVPSIYLFAKRLFGGINFVISTMSSNIIDAFPLLSVDALDVQMVELNTCSGGCFRLEYFCKNGHIYTELGKTQQLFFICFPKTTNFHSCHWARWLSRKWAREHGYNVRSLSPYVVAFGRLSNFMDQMKLKSFEDCRADANLPLLFMLFQLGWFGRVQYEARELTNKLISPPQITSTKPPAAGFSHVKISELKIFTIALRSFSGVEFFFSYFVHNGIIFTQLDTTQRTFCIVFPRHMISIHQVTTIVG